MFSSPVSPPINTSQRACTVRMSPKICVRVNLAAFEMVDYVVIDRNDKPLENLETIQPDYFAKGFEYNASRPFTRDGRRSEVVEAYGGEIIFTPGDIVYSSSALINLAPPAVKLETLQILMERNDLTFDHTPRGSRSDGAVNVSMLSAIRSLIAIRTAR